MFAAARHAAGTSRDTFDAATVAELLERATARYGAEFAAVLVRSRIWVNGEPADASDQLRPDDEVAVLPPVSGGAVEAAVAEKPRRRRLAVVPRDDGPHVRLGIAWAMATTTVVVASAAFEAAGTLPVAVWFAAVAGLGAAQAARGWRARPRRPYPPVVLAGAIALPLAAAAGWVAVGLAALAVTMAAVAVDLASPRARRARDPGLTVLLAIPIGLAAASPVLAARIGLVEPLVLLAMVWAFDAGCYVVGSGASAPWEGAAAGVVSVVPVTVAAAVALVGTFPAAPLVLGGVTALLAPFGPPMATILIGDERASVVRRIDSMLLAGPAWAATASFVLS